ncbi:MAG: 4Fe-4S binding protein [Magnetococcales bacterium]|nr:4Fe-4S binding protein [Magnetococcales bacterium]
MIWILLAGAILGGLAWGQFHCSWLCPFGALQEWISWIGQRLGWHASPHPAFLQRARLGRFFLLAVTVVLVWVTGNPEWSAFNPMQGFFANQLNPWLLAAAVLFLVASLFFFRFWCRYGCPLGTLLALFNKIALLDHLAPRRRFNQCDLHAHHPFDLECLHCHRCLAVPPSASPPPSPNATRLLTLFLALGALLIGVHLATLFHDNPDGAMGWRRIDTQAITSRIGTGRLSNHEAEWYRPAQDR